MGFPLQQSCGEVELSIREITGTACLCSEQYVVFSSSRCKRDFDDLTKMYSWF